MSTESTSLTELTTRYTLSIDHQLALRAARRRLDDEFAETFNTETVERFLAGSYDQFATGASIPNYVHIFAERFARLRLVAFSRVEGHLDAARPIVLFVCRSNDLYSPMARGLFERTAGVSALAWSAGLRPSVGLSPHVEAVMNSAGVRMSDEFPKPIAPEMLNAATVVVTFGCEDDIAPAPGRRHYAVPAPAFDTTDRDELQRLRTWLEDGMSELHKALFPTKAAALAPGHHSATFTP